jgi:hypothetical protein
MTILILTSTMKHGSASTLRLQIKRYPMGRRREATL